MVRVDIFSISILRKLPKPVTVTTNIWWVFPVCSTTRSYQYHLYYQESWITNSLQHVHQLYLYLFTSLSSQGEVLLSTVIWHIGFTVIMADVTTHLAHARFSAWIWYLQKAHSLCWFGYRWIVECAACASWTTMGWEYFRKSVNYFQVLGYYQHTSMCLA